MNDILLSQFVQHGRNFLVQLHRFYFIGSRLQSFDKSTGGLSLISVSQTLYVVGANSL